MSIVGIDKQEGRMKIISLIDYERSEYLDGSMMQYCIEEGFYPGGRVIAYVGNKNDALKIAKLFKGRGNVLNVTSNNYNEIYKKYK